MTINTAWTEPDGMAMTSVTGPEMRSFTLYTSLSTLDSVESSDSGNYSCTVTFDNGVKVSAFTNVKIGKLVKP